MAQVSMELRTVIQFPEVKLFNFDYPCDDAAWKTKLEEIFIRSYYFHEIGFETIDRFLYELETKFKLIMPYYNNLYKTTLLSIDPLITSKSNEIYKATNKVDSTSTTTDTTTATNTDQLTDYQYPQNADELTDIAAGRKVNNGSATNNATTGNVGKTDNIMDYEKIITGLSGDQSALLKSYRANIININQMIIRECKNLFILIY